MPRGVRFAFSGVGSNVRGSTQRLGLRNSTSARRSTFGPESVDLGEFGRFGNDVDQTSAMLANSGGNFEWVSVILANVGAISANSRGFV